MPIPFQALNQALKALLIPLLLGGAALAAPQGSAPAGDDPALQLIRGGGTPAVFNSGNNRPQPGSSCPAIVNVAAGEIQPLQITPAQVAAKNKLGCLSPNDAIYGANGCPLRLCGPQQGVMPLP